MLRRYGQSCPSSARDRALLSSTDGCGRIAQIQRAEDSPVPKVKQLTISCDNAPGSLARIAGILGSAKANILALNASSAGAMGYIQFVVDNGTKAKKALEGNGISCYEEFVLHTTLPNVPGALAQFARKLAAKDINIGAWLSDDGARCEEGKRSVCSLPSTERC